ncbi:MAG: response regulator transcription factor [Anaerolineales bacterium]
MSAISLAKTDPIRVLIADDHDQIRSSLSIFLEVFDDLELVGAAHNGQEALKLCKELEPDIVLLDLLMPQMDGVAATREIRRIHPYTQVIVLTSFYDETILHKALQAGASHYLLKDVTIDELAAAIRSVHGQKLSNLPASAPIH